MNLKFFDKRKPKSNEERMKIREEKWVKEKDLLQRKQKLRNERKSFRPKLLTTTKWIILFLFLNCTAIEIFKGWATIQSLNIALATAGYVDFTPLVALIGAVVGEVTGFGIYAAKAAKENSVDGITYMKAQAELGLPVNNAIEPAAAVG